MASSSQGDNCLIFPVPLYTVTTVGIIKSYESFHRINRVVITKGNIVDKIMVFSILLFMNLQNGIYAISTVSDSLVVQIEDLQSPDVEIFSDLSTLCELMTSFNGNYVPRAGMTSQLPFTRLIKYTICISRYCVDLTSFELVIK